MGRTVTKYWEDNAAPLAAVPAIATIKRALDTLLEDINQHVQQQAVAQKSGSYGLDRW